MHVQTDGNGTVLSVAIAGPIDAPLTSKAYGTLHIDLTDALANRTPVALNLEGAELLHTESAHHLVNLADSFHKAHTPLGLCQVPSVIQQLLITSGVPESTFHKSVDDFSRCFVTA